MKQHYLDRELKDYSKRDIYPFHMPGHKRRDSAFLNPYAIDITEIEGFDNLHKPEGILLEAKERLAKLYGAKESFFLVNGSTCGLLASISAATKREDTILIARNCHKAVFHAAELNQLHLEYLYPAITKEGIQGSIAPEDVRKALEQNLDITAVVLTSPTYDGILSDIQKIAGIVHEKGIPLIIDEAHGAHLGFSEGFPVSAITQGADAVIQSFHKTLPALTQTAVLHLGSERISSKRVQKYLGIYQTSSPSYLLMASIDRCVRILEEKGAEYFASFESKLQRFYESVKDLEKIRVLTGEDFSKKEAYGTDPSKLLLYTGTSNLTGMELMSLLRDEWNIELEMASGYYALAMSSIMDEEEGFTRLADALHAIDKRAEKKEGESFDFMKDLYGEKEVVYPVWEAEEKEKEVISLNCAKGRIAANAISLYPPGIPILLAGERIDGEFLRKIEECKRRKLNLCGLSDKLNQRIEVVIS